MAMLVGDSLRNVYRGGVGDMSDRDMEWFTRSLAVLMTQGESGPVRRGLMPDLNEAGMMPNISMELPESTHFRVTPFRRDDLGTVAFDSRLGGLVAKSNIVKSEVDEYDLGQMEHWRLEPGQQFQFDHDPDGNNVYYFVSNEAVSHSPDLDIEVHAKSTTGRLGCQAKGVGRTQEGKLITLCSLLRLI